MEKIRSAFASKRPISALRRANHDQQFRRFYLPAPEPEAWCDDGLHKHPEDNEPRDYSILPPPENLRLVRVLNVGQHRNDAAREADRIAQARQYGGCYGGFSTFKYWCFRYHRGNGE